jgi:hypothetical protein
MRQLLRITATFALALVFSAGMAFGQSPDNETQVDQEGNDNTADVEQVGQNQRAFVDQNGPGNSADADEGHRAFITQKGIQDGIDGKNNTAVVDQRFESNFAHSTTINQFGAGNQAGANQGGNFAGNTVEIEQTGENNYSAIQQSSAVTFKSTQTGDNNIIAGFAPGFDQLSPPDGARGPARQETGAPFDGDLGLMDFTQMGDGNRIAGAEQNVGRSLAKVYQDGGSEITVLTQTGGDHTVRLDQFSGSEAEIIQKGSNNELAGADQDGNFIDGGVAEQTNADLNFYGEKSALQNGSGNELGLFQDNGTANISQLGSSNKAVLYQDGSNTTSILQTGNEDLSRVIQDGTGNQATITQEN